MKELLYRFCGEYTTEKLISMEKYLEHKAVLEGKTGISTNGSIDLGYYSCI